MRLPKSLIVRNVRYYLKSKTQKSKTKYIILPITKHCLLANSYRQFAANMIYVSYFFGRSAAAIVLAVVTELEETVVTSTMFLFGINFCRHSYLAIFYDQKPARPHSRLPRPMSCPRGKKAPRRPARGGPAEGGIDGRLRGDNTRCDIFLCLCVTWGK